MDSLPELSIIVPAFNEAGRIDRTIADLARKFAATDVELIVVDDGSTDRTSDIARLGIPDTLRSIIIRFDRNRGKGAAVRAGVGRSTGKLVLVMDADEATELDDFDHLLAALDRADIAIGSRAVPGSVVTRSNIIRRIMGRTFNRMMRLLLKLDVRDSQCGFKLFRGDVARLVHQLSRIDRFGYDPEVLRIAVALDFRITEVPVTWHFVSGSKVRPVRDSAVTGGELLLTAMRFRPTRVRRNAARLGWSPAD